MHPRLSFDISWRDLLWLTSQCVWPRATGPSAADIAGSTEAVVTLSVRSAFDLLLAALDLPAGSEVLVSEVTVPHMERIVREHQLVPVAVPVNPLTLNIATDEVAARVSEQSRLLLVAHLFGTRMPLEGLGQLCRERNLMLIEDSAQALTCGTLSRDADVDVNMFSFGPIKTATALGGGIALVKDDALRQRMQQIADDWPRQSTTSYASRVAKVTVLKLLSQPALFSLVVELVNRTLGDADAFVGNSARGFPNDRLFDALRQQPCGPLRKMIARRLRRFDEQQIQDRTRRGRLLAEKLPAGMFVAGGENASHTYWVFPLICSNPSEIVSELRNVGFDASQISGLAVLGEAAENHWFARTVFVPAGAGIPERVREKLMSVLQKQ